MRVIADFDLCESNAICVEQAPEVFRVGQDDQLHILVVAPDESLRERVENAVRLCPRQALSLVDD